jgi:pyrophosphatase PpaX
MSDDTLTDTSPEARLRDLQAVLFDLDGTLIDTVELILVSMRHATLEVLGASPPDDVLMSGVGMPLVTQFRDFAPEHADELLRVYRAFNHVHHDDIAKAYPGTLDVLDRLRSRGVRMGIVTSKGEVAASMGIDRFGLRGFAEVIVTADDVEIHKPDPYPLAYAATLLNVDLRYCVYVGDSPHDMFAAVSGGAIPVAALWGAFPPDELLAPGPDFALSDIRELPALLAGETERFSARRS